MLNNKRWLCEGSAQEAHTPPTMQPTGVQAASCPWTKNWSATNSSWFCSSTAQHDLWPPRAAGSASSSFTLAHVCDELKKGKPSDMSRRPSVTLEKQLIHLRQKPPAVILHSLLVDHFQMGRECLPHAVASCICCLKASGVCHRISVNSAPIWNIAEWCQASLNLTGDPAQIDDMIRGLRNHEGIN